MYSIHPASGAGTANQASAELLTISDPRVRLVSVVVGDDEQTWIVRLQSFADEPVDVELTPGVAVDDAVRSTYLVDATGAPTTPTGGVARMAFKPFEAATIRVRRAARGSTADGELMTAPRRAFRLSTFATKIEASGGSALLPMHTTERQN
jgi:hypothetical protein